MNTETITFITWPAAGCSGWVMVHACSHMTNAGVPSFPQGPSSDGVIVGFKELNIPVPKEHLIGFVTQFIHKTLKLTDHPRIGSVEFRECGNGCDMIVTYPPKQES